MPLSLGKTSWLLFNSQCLLFLGGVILYAFVVVFMISLPLALAIFFYTYQYYYDKALDGNIVMTAHYAACVIVSNCRIL